ncbi:MAG: hypothetical protein ABI844_11100 [Saprospiraceae bacterium]
MKNIVLLLTCFFTSISASYCLNLKDLKSDTLKIPPYNIKLLEHFNEKIPALHSHTHAIYKDKIVMIGGRKNGLHGGKYIFNQNHTNKRIYVIDTKNWAPVSKWEVHAMSDSKIALDSKENHTSNFHDKSQFRGNNAEFFTEGKVLYLIGGLIGKDSINNPNGPNTLPLFTAIDLPALIDQVLTKTPMKSGSIRQAVDTNFALTGGEIEVMNNNVYLVFGWDFSFKAEKYSHKILSFQYQDDIDLHTLNYTFNRLCSTCWDGQSPVSNTGAFRRRDGSMSPAINPKDGSEALLYYGGVFKNGDTNFDNMIWINDSSAKELPFQMMSNVYTCQVIPVFSTSRKLTFATLLGGMRNADYTGSKNEITEMNSSNTWILPADIIQYLNVPFTNQFTTITVDADLHITQYMMPDSFPPLAKTVTIGTPKKHQEYAPVLLSDKAPVFNGTESEMLWTIDFKYKMPNGVIDFDKFIQDYPVGARLGFLHGGILSGMANLDIENDTDNQGRFSIGSRRIFEVFLVPAIK